MADQPDKSNGRKTTTGAGAAPLVPATALTDVLAELPDGRPFEAVSPVAATPGNRQPFSPADFLQVKWWVIGVSVILAVGLIPWIWIFLAPAYRARSVVRVSPVVSRIVFNTEDNGMLPLYQSYMNTQVSIIRSAAVLERVLDRSDVAKTKWYNEKDHSLFGPPLSRLERLQDALTVRPRRRTELIDVSVMVRTAKDAEVLANAIVSEYKRYTDESFREQDIRRNETLRESRTALQREIAGLVATKFSLSERLGTTDPEDLRTQISAELSALETRRATLARELAMARWELETYPAPPVTGPLASAGVSASANASPTTPDNSSEVGPQADEVGPQTDEVGPHLVDKVDSQHDTGPEVDAGRTAENGNRDHAGSAVGAAADAQFALRTSVDEQKRGAASDKSVSLTYASDFEWRKQNLALEAKRHDLSLARQRYGDRHPIILALLSDVAHAKRLLKEREAQLEDEREAEVDGTKHEPVETPPAVVLRRVDPKLVSRAELERKIQRLKREIEILDPEIERKGERVAEAGEIAKDIARYDEEIGQKREVSDRLRRRLTELDMESRAPARISVASHAVKPSRPFRDRRILLSVMVLFGSIGAGLGVGYLRIVTDTRIRGAGEVQHAVQAPFLGQLPPFLATGDLMSECTNPIMIERVRMVRTALLKRLGNEGPHVILITSSASRTGKTSLSYLLSRSLAGLGKRTLLVETDLRRPSLSAQLKIESKGGLTALLEDRADDGSVTVSAGLANLDLITAGDAPGRPNPELLANGVFAACLKRWRTNYDFILLDSPPVLPVADARILAGHADGTVMVLRSAYCRREQVVQAYADLSAAGGTLLGTVLVGAPDDGRSGYYPDYDAYADSFPVLEARPRDDVPHESLEV